MQQSHLVLKMNICVGGELDGQKIEKEGRLLKASDIDPSLIYGIK
ncbi:hypothetical protein [Acinetobacter baumannii]